MNRSMFRQLSAIVPLAMSLAALVLVIYHLIADSSPRAPDEGTAAHVFQLLIVGQAPFAAYFAVRWIPREPGPAMQVLALQAAAAVVALAPVVLTGM